MNKVNKKYLSSIIEISIILLVLLLNDSLFKKTTGTIKADGIGYYEYLPAAFIYNDLNFNYRDSLEVDGNYISSIKLVVKDHNGHNINKYFIGLSVLWSPFFALAHVYASNSHFKADGFSYPYHLSIFIASILYLWLGLLYLRKLLLLYGFKRWIIACVQIAFVFATPLINYATFNCSASHVYSFTLLIVFTYHLYKYRLNKKSKQLYLSAFFLGLIFIVRPVNIIIIAILPFFFSSYKEFRNFIIYLFRTKYFSLITALGIFALSISIQFIIWKIQTGDFIVYSYQEEGFNFLNPAYFDFLFSYRKGAFLYTPLLFIILLSSSFVLLKQKRYYSFLSITALLLVIFYILSSWWYWSYGATIGQRPLIDFYVIFAILMAIRFKELKKPILKGLAALVLVGLISINLIQVYQYQYYLILRDRMTKEKYWEVFLKTEDKYKGLLYYPLKRPSEGQKINSYQKNYPEGLTIKDVNLKSILIIDSVNFIDQEKVDIVHIKLDGCVKNGNSKLIFTMKDESGKGVAFIPFYTFTFLGENNCDGGDLYFKLNKSIPKNGQLILFGKNIDDDWSINSIELLLESSKLK